MGFVRTNLCVTGIWTGPATLTAVPWWVEAILPRLRDEKLKRATGLHFRICKPACFPSSVPSQISSSQIGSRSNPLHSLSGYVSSSSEQHTWERGNRSSFAQGQTDHLVCWRSFRIIDMSDIFSPDHHWMGSDGITRPLAPGNVGQQTSSTANSVQINFYDCSNR